MATGWFKGPVCGTDNCPSRRYRSSDGLTICQYGHVMEGNIEIDDDQDTVAVPTRRLNAVAVDARGGFTSGGTSQGAVAKDNARLYGREGRRLYYRCLQALLKRQYEIVASIFFGESADPELLLLVKANWIKIISPYIDDDDDKTTQSDLSEQNDHKDDQQSDDGPRPDPSKRKQVVTLDLVALIYISALQLRLYPLYASEAIAAITTNAIPYIRCLHLIPQAMLDRLQMSYHRILQPTTLPVKGEFYECVATNMHRLGLATPWSVPTNFYYPYVFTVVSETLMLPNTLRMFGAVVEVTRTLGAGQTVAIDSTRPLRQFPELQLAAVVLYLVRAHFAYQVVGRPVNRAAWYRAVADYEENHALSFLISDTRQLIDWSDAKIERYCDWLYDNMLPDKKKTLDDPAPGDELPIMEKRLYQLFDTSSASPPPARPSLAEYFQKMVDPHNGEGGENDPMAARDADAKLAARLCEALGITPTQLARCYDDTTAAIARALDPR